MGVGQADGSRQRQSRNAAEDEAIANMKFIIAGNRGLTCHRHGPGQGEVEVRVPADSQTSSEPVKLSLRDDRTLGQVQ